jgi:hypothetical protein
MNGLTRSEIEDAGWQVNITSNPTTIGKITKPNGFVYGIKYFNSDDSKFFLIHSVKNGKSLIESEYTYKGPIENKEQLKFIMRQFGLLEHT